jgi:hypothetical protein
MSDRQMTLSEMQSSTNALTSRTFSAYKTVIKRLNQELEYEDHDTIYYDRYNDQVKELPDIIKRIWNIPNMQVMKQKLSIISSLMTRCDFGKNHNIKTLIGMADRDITVEHKKPIDKVIPEWNDLQKMLDQAGDNDNVAGTIAKIFSYGYVLRVGEIFNTKTLNDDGINNFLDLDKCVWIVRKQKNKTTKEFDVNPELCSRLPRKSWLLAKADGSPYSERSMLLPYHGWTLPNNTTLRKSYETWNVYHSGRTPEEIKNWNYILGHTPETVLSYYVPEQNSLPKKIKPIIKLRVKSKPKPEAHKYNWGKY